MRILHRFSVILCGMCFAAISMAADELMVFPSADQSAEQQEADKFTCYGWAKNESGFDPMAPPTATAPPPEKQSTGGTRRRGLLRGAALGGIVDGSDGAKKGAAAGLLIGGARSRDKNRQDDQAQAQWEQEQSAIYSENRNRYNRAYSACLEGRNYTVR